MESRASAAEDQLKSSLNRLEAIQKEKEILLKGILKAHEILGQLVQTFQKTGEK